MTDYTIWNGTIPVGATNTATGLRTDGIQFTVSSSCQLDGIAYYVPPGETTLTGSSYTATLYTTTTGTSGTSVASAAGAGTFTAGAWNWIPLSFTLAPGTVYVAAITSPNLLEFLHSYWSVGGPGQGGITSGPVSVPDEATAAGLIQQGNIGGAAFPANTNGSWYGVDIKVTVAGGGAAEGIVPLFVPEVT